jgi:hypothetical protein
MIKFESSFDFAKRSKPLFLLSFFSICSQLVACAPAEPVNLVSSDRPLDTEWSIGSEFSIRGESGDEAFAISGLVSIDGTSVNDSVITARTVASSQNSAIETSGQSQVLSGSSSVPVIASATSAAPVAAVSASIAAGLSSKAVWTIELQDWTGGSGVVVGSTKLDKPLEDIVWDDPELARNMGVVKVQGTDAAIKWLGFEFGAIRLSSPVAAEGSRPLEQVLIGAKPSGRWSTYPYADTFDPRVDQTHPPAFKVVLREANGAVIHTFEMRDGLPINSPQLSQTRLPGTGPLRPFFNVGMLLPWQSALPKLNPNFETSVPQFTANYPESRSKLAHAYNGANPMLAPGAFGRQQFNGYNHWHQLPKWPLAPEATGEVNLDPYAYNVATYGNGDPRKERSAWVSGWDYEPGSVSGHDWFTGPGGMRHDRAVVPVPLAYLFSNPNYRRPKDLTPIRDLANAWGLAYFNHSGHYLRDVQRFTQILGTSAERATHRQMGAYYGNRKQFAPTAQSIDMRGITNGDYRLEGDNGGTPDSYYLDKAGNRFWNGWLVDAEHLHQTPYWYLIALSSPMHLLASRAAFNQSFLARLGMTDMDMRPTSLWNAGPSYTAVNSRVQAWRWMHYAMMWKVGSNSSFGFRQADVEKMFIEDLHAWHDKILIPTLNETKNPFHVAIKKLGVPVSATQKDNLWYLSVEGSALNYYHAGVFLTMKKMGLWDKLRTDAKSKAVLDFVVDSMNKFSVDFILDADGRPDTMSFVIAGPFNRFEDIDASHVPNWSEWAQMFPKRGLQSWIRQENGAKFESYAGPHLRAQWAIMMRDWFPEHSSQRIRDAASKYEAYYREWAVDVDRKTLPIEKTFEDFQSQGISYSTFRPPK